MTILSWDLVEVLPLPSLQVWITITHPKLKVWVDGASHKYNQQLQRSHQVWEVMLEETNLKGSTCPVIQMKIQLWDQVALALSNNHKCSSQSLYNSSSLHQHRYPSHRSKTTLKSLTIILSWVQAHPSNQWFQQPNPNKQLQFKSQCHSSKICRNGRRKTQMMRIVMSHQRNRKVIQSQSL